MKKKGLMLKYFFLYSSPLDQFEIRDYISINAPVLANLHLSISNIGLYLTTGFFIALYLNILATNYNKIISNT